MTIQQLHFFNGLYLVILVVVAIFTRATARRIAGALAGGAVDGVAALGIIALGEKVGWWHFAITWEPYFLTLLWIDVALCAFIFLITWRIARQFGWRGLAVVVVVAAALGPVRDYRYMARFPEWGAYAPGIAPVLAIAVTYVLLGVVGHAVMRLVAGPARADRLARRPWEAAEPAAELQRYPAEVIMLDQRQPYWSYAKRYGWGWGLPARREGWFVLIGWMIIVFAVSAFLAPRSMMLFFAFVFVMAAILIAICYAKGEPPHWRWGKPK